MFIIHRDQVEAFGARRRSRFEDEAAAALRHILQRDVAASFVTASVDRAIARGFHTDSLAWQYVALEAYVGGDLRDAWPWAEAILGHSSLTPLGKLRTLLREGELRDAGLVLVDFLNQGAS